MDILTDILNTAGLKRKILNQLSLSKPWALTFPCSQSIGFHVVTQGRGYLWYEEEKPITLNKGDIAFMSRGKNHHITTEPNRRLIKEYIEIPVLPKNNDGESILTLVSGAYQLWNDPIHPLLSELPECRIINSNLISYSDPLQHCLQLLSNEIESNKLGFETIIGSLLDVMFNLILRKIFDTQKNWGQALKDPILLKALELMHSEPNREWTVEGLATSVGLSRSGFALKFKQILSDTPLNYLTTLRIFKASDLLSNTDYNLEKIAYLVGYKDAFSFSRSFKRLSGMSPKEFREKNEAQKKLIWNFY